MSSPHVSSGIVERAKRDRARKSLHALYRCVSRFLAWGDFHVRSLFVRSSLSEEKWGLLVVYPIIDSGHKKGPSQNLK